MTRECRHEESRVGSGLFMRIVLGYPEKHTDKQGSTGSLAENWVPSENHVFSYPLKRSTREEDGIMVGGGQNTP